MSGRLLSVNYHYVRVANYPHPGIHPMEPEAFDAQVAALKARVHCISPAEVEAYLFDGAILDRDAVLLTFDDGLRDHYDVVKPILESHGVQGVFCVSSRPLLEKRAVAVHKIHRLRAELGGDALRQALMERVAFETTDEIDEASRTTYRYDTPEDARLKYMINFILPHDAVDAATSDMLPMVGLDDERFCRETYMTGGEIADLCAGGHLIAAHGDRHIPLARYDAQDLNTDLKRNVGALEKATGEAVTWLSYPYGSAWAVPKDTDSIAEAHGFRVGLTMFRGWVNADESPMLLRRIDPKELPKYIEL